MTKRRSSTNAPEPLSSTSNDHGQFISWLDAQVFANLGDHLHMISEETAIAAGLNVAELRRRGVIVT